MQAEKYYQVQDNLIDDKLKSEKAKLKILKGRKYRRKAIVWTLIVFAAFFTIIARYSIMTQLNYDIARLNKELKAQNAVNSSLTVELDKKVNLPRIRHIAQSELGMKMPESYQIVYVEVPRSNKTEVTESGRGLNNMLAGFFSAIRTGFENLKAIFG
jgi:cell division protein FtsL